MKARLGLVALAILSGMLLLTIVSLGQSTETTIWHTVDGGGGVSQGDTFTVRSTIGQPDAGAMQGEGYMVAGGFWGGRAGRSETRVFIPLVVRDYPWDRDDSVRGGQRGSTLAPPGRLR
jgi:hypothetical protein